MIENEAPKQYVTGSHLIANKNDALQNPWLKEKQ
jgi:hypothetical protein